MNESNNNQVSQHSRILAPTFLLRLGLAFGFLYAGISSLANPTDWIWYVPDFTEIFISKNISLAIFSLVEVVMGFWLVWGKYLKYSALISALILGGITLISLNAFQITFRDVGLTLAALALFKLSEKE
ncbi:MAG: hypothetical protein AAB594_02025 [Patescibacteria group bacterium]